MIGRLWKPGDGRPLRCRRLVSDSPARRRAWPASISTTALCIGAVIIDHSTPEARIQSLIEIACADRNWLFNLPLMLDGLLRPGPVAGSLTAGKSGTTIDLGEPKTFDRLEFAIDNPNYRRGQARAFRLEVLQTDGQWHVVHQGNLYGTIYSKRFPAATGSQVRLVVDAPVTQLDVFPPGK